MIDEKKLIEDIDNCVVGLTNIQMMQIADIIETQPKVGEWIPCSERLPEKSGTYIVTGAWKGQPREIWTCELLVLKQFSVGWCNDAKRPVIDAWMPLPEPYKGVD